MIWSVIRLRTARRMFYISRWLLRVGEAIVEEEIRRRMARAVRRARSFIPTVHPTKK